MLTEKDIMYENGKFWVLRTKKSYEVYEVGVTHSVRRAVVGRSFPNALERAKQTCDKRQANQ